MRCRGQNHTTVVGREKQSWIRGVGGRERKSLNSIRGQRKGTLAEEGFRSEDGLITGVLFRGEGSVDQARTLKKKKTGRHKWDGVKSSSMGRSTGAGGKRRGGWYVKCTHPG